MVAVLLVRPQGLFGRRIGIDGARPSLGSGGLLVAVPWIVAAAVPGQQRYVLHV
jgi:hypothetical protein